MIILAWKLGMNNVEKMKVYNFTTDHANSITKGRLISLTLKSLALYPFGKIRDSRIILTIIILFNRDCEMVSNDHSSKMQNFTQNSYSVCAIYTCSYIGCSVTSYWKKANVISSSSASRNDFNFLFLS
jgi:hypothetical protein